MTSKKSNSNCKNNGSDKSDCEGKNNGPAILDRRAVMCVKLCLRENLDDGFVDGVLGDEAYDLLGYFAALEEQQRGDTANAVTHGRCSVGVDVHLHDLELALIVARDFIDNGRKRSTGAAPRSPEIYQDRLIGL
jgi:hypothetical protein